MAAFRTRQAQSPHRNRYTHLDDDRSGEIAVPDPVRRVLSTPGQSLDAAVQSDLAERLGDRFDDVTIHTGPEAANACESIDARA
ncbi:eCIS core domain-containing protein, partial [Natrialba chahannaoensis]